MNNKGFAISTLLYGLSILGLLLIILLMSTVTSNRINTRELVKQIEEDLDRFSATQTTFKSTDDAASAKEYIVASGRGGWYKIELWSAQNHLSKRGDYKTMTVKIPEYVTLYVYVGNNVTPESMVCLTNAGRNECTSTTTIESTAVNDWSTRDLVQSSSISETQDDEGNYAAENIKIETSSAQNKVLLKNTNSGSGRVRITLVSQNDDLVSSSNPTEYKGNYYIVTNAGTETEPEWVALTANNKDTDNVTANSFVGNKNQTWTISNSPPHSYINDEGQLDTKDILGEKYYSIINVGNGRALASTTEAAYGSLLYTNKKYVENNDLRTQDWLINQNGTIEGTNIPLFNLYPYEKNTEYDLMLQNNCGYTGSNNRFCIGKRSLYDGGDDQCIESEKFKDDVSLNFHCQNLRFINAEV